MKPRYFIDNHNYSLKSLTEEYRDNVIKYKKYGINVNNIPCTERIDFNLKYPGMIYSDFSDIINYCTKLYSPIFTNVFTPPRGYVGRSTTLVIGISPGFSSYSFSESSLLFGPSSKVLHELLNFTDGWYFTNITKTPFLDNKYNEDQVKKEIHIISKEIEFFKDHKIIFLGKYEPFDLLIKSLQLENYIKIKHPSYFVYKGRVGLDEERQKVMEFAK